MSNLNIFLEKDEENQRIDISLHGAATFMMLPKLSSVLDPIPPNIKLYVHLNKLAYIDHSCFDWLSIWAKQQQQRGSTVIMQWDTLEKRFRRPFQTL